MCEYCMSYPHIPGCPAEPEPKSVHTCALCGWGIYEDEEFYQINGQYYHDVCLEDMGVPNILGLLGIEKEREV